MLGRITESHGLAGLRRGPVHPEWPGLTSVSSDIARETESYLLVIVYMDLVVCLFMIHLVGCQDEVVDQIFVPEPGTIYVSWTSWYRLTNDLRDQPFSARTRTTLGNPNLPIFKTNEEFLV